MSLVHILNSQTSKSKAVMSLMRPFVIFAMQNHVIFRDSHIPCKYNEIADSISRQQWQRFRQLAPTAEVELRHIPASFLEMISNVKLTDC